MRLSAVMGACCALSILALGPAYAGGSVLKAEQPVCETKESFDALVTLSVAGDLKGVEVLIANGQCAVFEDSIDASVLETDAWSGARKIMLHHEVGTIVVWAPADGVIIEE